MSPNIHYTPYTHNFQNIFHFKIMNEAVLACWEVKFSRAELYENNGHLVEIFISNLSGELIVLLKPADTSHILGGTE